VLALVAGLAPLAGAAQPGDRIGVGAFAIDRTEVTVSAFERFVAARNLRTRAELEGGGFEFVGGWTRRPGWSFRTPSGAPASPNDPAVHVDWAEARAYCTSVAGRLPSFAEWRQAAYTESRETPTTGWSEVGPMPTRSATIRPA
jgi:formylglycine-generating enzyme required for sulfatase activity